MAHISEERYAEFKRICEKEGIKYDTEEQYRDAARSLVTFVDALCRISAEERQRELRLEQEPNGFMMIGEGRTCSLCKQNISGDMWYDKWGMKCTDCQAALSKKIVPGYVFKDHKNENHITASALSWRFDLRIQTIRKLVRQGKLKAREVPGNGTLVFLRRENPDLLETIETEKASKKSG